MSTMLIQSDTLTDIADAIRDKLGVQDTYLPSEMPDAIESISGGGGIESPVELDTPLFTLIQHDPADSVFTATEQMRVLVMNTMIIFEAGNAHDSAAITTTTGTLIDEELLTTDYGTDYNRDATTRVSLIDLEAGDTITMTNTSRTTYVVKNRTIWRADNVASLDSILYDTVVDSRAYDTRTLTYDNSDIYLVFLYQASGANNNLSADIDVTFGYVLNEYQVNVTNNRIDSIVCMNPSNLICTTADADNYTSKMFIVLKLTPITMPSKIIYSGNRPTSAEGADGDYFYRRVIQADVCVPYWDSKQNSSTSISGYEFTTAEACDVVGVRVYNRGSQGTVTAGLYNEDGTVIEEVTGQAVGNNWTSLMFANKHRLQSSTKYLSIANWGESGHTVYRSTYTIATDSRIVSSSLKGRYNSIPGSVDNDNVYGCDVLLESDDGYYIITEQYVKENGAWVQLA